MPCLAQLLRTWARTLSPDFIIDSPQIGGMPVPAGAFSPAYLVSPTVQGYPCSSAGIRGNRCCRNLSETNRLAHGWGTGSHRCSCGRAPSGLHGLWRHRHARVGPGTKAVKSRQLSRISTIGRLGTFPSVLEVQSSGELPPIQLTSQGKLSSRRGERSLEEGRSGRNAP